LDRRQRRRRESIEEILDVALDLMADQGVAGLSLGEVARRLGIRPPSLYVYFPSKNAVYDALFARGAEQLLDTVTTYADEVLRDATGLEPALLEVGGAMVRWAIENPVYSQLLFWRPVPGFEPTAESYRPAVEMVERSEAYFVEMQQRGWLRDDLPAAELLRDWTIVVAGIVSQQLSNAPQDGFDTGRFTTALPSIVAMFCAQYAATPPARPSSAPVRRSRRAHQR
jgi:AcrR family transcriptional regulator